MSASIHRRSRRQRLSLSKRFAHRVLLAAVFAAVGTASAQDNHYTWSDLTNFWDNPDGTVNYANWDNNPLGSGAFIIGTDPFAPPYSFTQIRAATFTGTYLNSAVGLTLSGGGLNLTDAGTASTIGGDLNLTGGSFKAVGAVNVSGGLNLSAGSVSISDAVNGLSAAGGFTWSGGTLSGGGLISIAGPFSINAANGATVSNSAILNLGGAGTWTNGSIVDNAGGTFNVLVGATLNVNADAVINNGTFLNAGTMNLNATSLSNANGYYGIEADNTTNSGTIVNTGIEDADIFANSTLSNSGAITNQASGATALGGGNFLTVGANSLTTNSGLIQATVSDSGLWVYDNTGTTDNEGTIKTTGDNSFLYVTGKSQVLNNGVIDQEGSGSQGQISPGAGGWLHNTTGGAITKSGSGTLTVGISTSNVENKGIVSVDGSGAAVDLGGNWINDNTGTIQATNGGSVVASGTVSNQGLIQLLNNSTVNITGSLTLQGGGSISGGTVLNSSKLFFDGNSNNTLDGVTLSDPVLNGGLDMSGGNWTSVYIQGGTQFGTNPTLLIGSTAGNYYNGGSVIRVNQDQTFTGATLTFGDLYYTSYLASQNGHNLTFDAGTTVTGRFGIGSDQGGGVLTNAGSITATGGSGQNPAIGNGFAQVVNTGTLGAQNLDASLTLQGPSWDNQGTLTSDASSVNGYWGSLTNEGTIHSINGGYFWLNSFDNTSGHIVADGANSIVQIGQNESTPVLGDLHAQNGGTIWLNSNLDNSGSTLDAAAVAGTGTFELFYGSISGGTILNSSKLSFNNFQYNTLDGVTLSDPTLNGGLDLSAGSEQVAIQNGTTFGANPTFLLGNDDGSHIWTQSWLRVNQDETFTGATFDFGTDFYGYVGVLGSENGHNITFDGATTATGNVDIQSDNNGGTFTNQGSITPSYSGYWDNPRIGGGFTNVVNQGSITGANIPNTTLYLYGDNWDNQASGTVNANGVRINGQWGSLSNEGLLEATNGGTFNMNTVSSNSGTIEALGGSYVALGTVLSNTGTILADGSSSRLDMRGAYTTPTLGSVHGTNGSEVSLSGTLDNTGATFDPTTIADATSTFLLTGGTIANGSLVNSTKLFFDNNYSNTLDNVALDGGLDLSTGSESVRIQNGTTFGANPTLLLGNSDGNHNFSQSVLRVNQDQTFTGATLTFGTDYYGYDSYIYTENGHNLTFDSNTTATGQMDIASYNGGGAFTNQGSITTSASGYWDHMRIGTGFANVVNQGTITAQNTPNLYLYLQGSNWDNQASGTLNANGDRIVGQWGSLTNEGLIEATNGGFFQVGTVSSNTGTIGAYGAGSRVDLNGSYSTPNLGTLQAQSGAEVSLSGTLDNTGATFDPTTIADATSTFLVTGGTISGGSVVNSPKLRFDGSYYNTLDNVALDGGLDLSTGGESVRIQNGTTFGPNPTILMGNSDANHNFSQSFLRVNQDQAFVGATLTFGTDFYGYDSYIYTENGHNLTFDANTTATGQLDIASYNGGGTFTNQGTITPSASGYWDQMRIGTSFANVVNQGTITAQNTPNLSLYLQGANWDNQATGLINANGARIYGQWGVMTNEGLLEATNGGYFQAGTITNNTGTMGAYGTGSHFDLNGTYSTPNLGTLQAASGGEVSLSGTLDNTGATFDPTTIADATSSFLLTGGTITGGNLINSSKLDVDSSYYNTLDNVALDGGLDLSKGNRSVRIQNGTTFGPNPTILLGNDDASANWTQGFLRVNQDETLAGASIDFGTDYYGYDSYIYTENGHNLTFDANTVATGSVGIVSYNGGGTFTNKGSITASYTGYWDNPRIGSNFANVVNQGWITATNNPHTGAYLQGSNWDNQATGLINANGARIYGQWGAMTNEGLLEATNGGYLQAGTITSNTGTMGAYYTGSRFDLNGSYTTFALGTLQAQNGGEVSLSGSLDNSSATFDPASIPDVLSSFVVTGGTISGGTVVNSSKLRFDGNSSNTLNGVTLSDPTLNGGLNLSAGSPEVRIQGGTTFGANPTLLIGNTDGSDYYSRSVLWVNQDQTFTGANLKFGNEYVYNSLYVQNAHNLTFDPGTTVTGKFDIESYNGGGTFTNQGSTIASGAGGYAAYLGQNFTSVDNAATGTFGAQNLSTTLYLYGTAFTNEGAFVADGSPVQDYSGSFTNSGSVSVKNGGSLYIQPAYHQTAGSTDVSGSSTFNAPNGIQIDAGALSGDGTVYGDVANSGTIAPGHLNSGALKIQGSLTETLASLMDFSFTDGSDFTSINVSNAANLAGGIGLDFLNGYVPNVGSSFELVHYGSSSYDPSLFSLTSNYPGLSYVLEDQPNGLFLLVEGATGFDYWNGGPSGGDWSNAAKWSNGIPQPTNNVINPNNNPITHSAGTDTIESFVGNGAFELSGGTLMGNDASSTFQNNNTFLMDGGTLAGFTLNPGSGGQGVHVSGVGSILQNDTINTNINLAAGSYLEISGGVLNAAHMKITGDPASHSNGGTVNLEDGVTLAPGASLAVDPADLTIGNVTLAVGPGSSFSMTGGVLTNYGTLDAAGGTVNLAADAFHNVGITKASGSNISITGAEFSNSITLEALNGNTIDIATGSLYSTGLMLASGGAKLNLHANANYWDNGGTIQADGSGSIVQISGTPVSSGMGRFYSATNGGEIQLTGALDNTVATNTASLAKLDLSGTGGGAFRVVGGSITGGTVIHPELLRFTSDYNGGYSNLLNGVTLSGNLDLRQDFGEAVRFEGGTVATGQVLMGNESNVVFDTNSTYTGEMTLTDPVNESGRNDIHLDRGATLTLSPTAQIDGIGYLGLFSNWQYGPLGTIVNQGTISRTGAGYWQMYGADVQNSGTISTSGGTYYDYANQLENAGTLSVTSGGYFELNNTVTSQAGAKLQADGPSSVMRLFGSYPTGLGTITAMSGGQVELSGSDTNSGLDLAGVDATSAFTLASGQINGGTIYSSLNLSATGDGGANRLVGVTVDSGLNMNPYNTDIRILNGLTVSSGYVEIGQESNLVFDGTQTFDAGIQFTSAGSGHLNFDGNNTTLTLGTHSSITGGGYADLFGRYSYGSNSTIDNKGTIDQSDGTASHHWDLYGDTLQNDGVIEATSGGVVNIRSGAVKNFGTISAQDHSYVGFLPGWGSSGYQTADLGSFSATNGSTIALGRTLTNTANVLSLTGIDATSQFLLQSGEIDGGTITNSQALRATSDGNANRLQGVTLDTGLNLSSYNSDVRIVNGITIGSGDITVGQESNLIFDGSQTYSGDIQFTSGGTAHVNVDGTNTTTTFNSSIGGVGYADLFSPYSGGANRTIVNAGTIHATDPASYFILYGDHLQNASSGTIEATAGGSLYVSPTDFSNQGLMVADGAGSHLYLRNSETSTNTIRALDGGTVNLQGTLDSASGSIDTGSGPTAGTFLLNGGVLKNASVPNSSGLAATWDYNNVLRNVSVGQGLNFQNSEFSRIQTSGNAASQGLYGDVNLQGSGAVVFDGDQTYNGTATLSGGGRNYFDTEGGTNLILGSSAKLQGTGYADIGWHWITNSPRSLTNQGIIEAQSGANWSVGSTSLVNQGSFTVDSGANVSLSNAVLQNQVQTDVEGTLSGSVSNSGSLYGSGTITGSLTNSGILQPSPSLEPTLTIGGNFTATGSSELELNAVGTASGDFGQLHIGGQASFGGELFVSFLNGYSPNFGDSYELATYGNGDWTGNTFSSVVGSAPGFTYSAQYDPTGLFLVVSGAAGYVYWQGVNATGNWNDPTSWSTGSVPDGTLSAANLTNHGILHDSGTNSVKSFLSSGPIELSGGSVTGSIAASTWKVNNTFKLDGGALAGFDVEPGTSGQGVTVTGSGGTLLNDTIQANLDLTSGGSATVNGGTLQSTASLNNGATLGVDGGLDLTNAATIAFGATGSSRLSAEGNSTEILDGVALTGSHVNITSNALGAGTAGFQNDQTLSATGAGANWTINPSAFDNHGVVQALNGGLMTVDAATYGNLGSVISNGSGSVLDWNGGTVNASTGTLLAENSGVINFGSTLDLGGGSLDASTLSSSGGQFILAGGIIANGHLSNPGSIVFPSVGAGALENIDLTNGLNLGYNQTLRILGNFSVSGGQVNMDSYSRLEFDDNETLSNAVINFGSTGTSGFSIAPGKTLYLGGGVITTGRGVVQSNGGSLSFFAPFSLTNSSLAVDPTDLIIPLGGGLVVNSGGSFSMTGGTFTNDANTPGTNNAVIARGGGVIDLAPTNFYNNGTIESRTLSSITLAPTNWDNVGNINAVGSQADVHLGGGTINLATENGTLSSVNGGRFYLNTTLDDTAQTLDPDAIGGEFIVDGGTIYTDTGAHRGVLNTGTPNLEFTGNRNNVLWNVQFPHSAGLTMHGGYVDIRGDVLNYTGLWQLDGGAQIDFEASRDFENQTFALNGATWTNVPDTTGQDIQGAHPESTLSYTSTFSGTSGNIYVDKLHNYSNIVSPTGGSWYINSTEDWVNEFDTNSGFSEFENYHGSAGYGQYGQLNADGGSLTTNFNRFANNGVVQSESGGWMDLSAQVYDRVGKVQSTGAGSTTVLRGGTVVIGLEDELASYLGGVIRLGTTLDNTGNFLNPGDLTNTYVNGPFTVGYNGDYYHGGFWGTVLGGMVDSQSYDIRFENANLQNTTLTLADHATLSGLDLHNEHVHVLGTLATDYLFNLTNNSELRFDGNREFDNGNGEASAVTFTGTGNLYGMLGDGNLTLGAGTSLTGNPASAYTVQMGAGTLDLQPGVSVTGRNVSFNGGTIHVENGVQLDSVGVPAESSTWNYNINELDNQGIIHTGALGTTNLTTPVLNNQGVIRTDNGGLSRLNGTNWSNVGSVQVDGASSNVYLAGNITNDAASTLNGDLQATNNGVFSLGFGTYSPEGNVTNATPGSILNTALIGGSFHFNNGWLHSGELNSTAANLIFNYNFADYPYGWDDNLLDNVHLVDAANANAPAGLNLLNGGSVSAENVANDWSNWQFNLDNGGRLTFLTNTTLPDATQVHFNSNGILNPYNSTLTISPNAAFDGVNATIGEYYSYKDPHNEIVNHGNILSHNGGVWNMFPYELYNDGNIGVSNDSTLYLAPTVWDKLGTVSANGTGSILYLGDYTRGGTIQLGPNDTFSFTNGGTIQLGATLINHWVVAGNPVDGTIDAAGNGFFKIAGGGIQGGNLVIDTPSNPNTVPPINPNLQPLEFVPGYTNTLDGVTLKTPGGALASLDLRNGSSVSVKNALNSSNGFWLANGSQLSFDGDRDFEAGALGQAFFHFGADSAVYPYYNGGNVTVAGKLTFGPGTTATGGDAALRAGSMELVNGAAVTGDQLNLTTTNNFRLDGGTLAPNGAPSGSYLDVTVGSLDNFGTIESFNGSSADINATTWNTVGHISAIGAGSVTYLDGGKISPDWTIHPITAAGGGAFVLRTTLDDTAGGPLGQFFDPALIGGHFTIQGGTLLNGRVNSTSPDLRLFNATYDGVSLTDGSGSTAAGQELDSAESLTIKNGFSSNNQFNLTGSSLLQFSGDRSFGAGANFVIDHSQLNELNDGTLTFNAGAGVVGPDAWIGNVWWGGANTGRVAVGPGEVVGPTTAGDEWAITPANLNNQGTIDAVGGSRLYLTVNNWENLGSLFAGANSSIVLDGGDITDDPAHVGFAANATGKFELRNVLNNIGYFLNPGANGLTAIGGMFQVGGSDFKWVPEYYQETKSGYVLGGRIDSATPDLSFTNEPEDHRYSTGWDNVLDGVTLTDSTGLYNPYDSSTVAHAAGLNLNNGGTVRIANDFFSNNIYQLDRGARVTFSDDQTVGTINNNAASFQFGPNGGGTVNLWDHTTLDILPGTTFTGPVFTVTGDAASRFAVDTGMNASGLGTDWTLSPDVVDNRNFLRASNSGILDFGGRGDAQTVLDRSGSNMESDTNGLLRFNNSNVTTQASDQIRHLGPANLGANGSSMSFSNGSVLTNQGNLFVINSTFSMNASTLMDTGTASFDNSDLGLVNSHVFETNPASWTMHSLSMDGTDIHGSGPNPSQQLGLTLPSSPTFSASRNNLFEFVDLTINPPTYNPQNLSYGTLDLSNGGFLRVRSSTLNVSAISLGTHGVLDFDGNAAVNAGIVTFDQGGASPDLAMEPGSTLILADGTTLVGNIGSLGGQLPGSPPSTQPRVLQNNGAIIVQNEAADHAASIDATSFKNTGTVRVDDGNQLDITGSFLSTNNGVVDVNGTIDMTGGNQIDFEGGTLTGFGTVNASHGIVVNGTTIHAGGSPGHMVLGGDLTMGPTATMLVDIGGYQQGPAHEGDPGYSYLEVHGNAGLSGTLDIESWAGFVPTQDYNFTFLTTTGLITGAFTTIDTTGFVSQPGGSFSVVVGSNNAYLHYHAAAPVPEPGSFLAMGSGLAFLAFRRRKKAQQALLAKAGQ